MQRTGANQILVRRPETEPLMAVFTIHRAIANLAASVSMTEYVMGKSLAARLNARGAIVVPTHLFDELLHTLLDIELQETEIAAR